MACLFQTGMRFQKRKLRAVPFIEVTLFPDAGPGFQADLSGSDEGQGCPESCSISVVRVLTQSENIRTVNFISTIQIGSK